MALFLTYRVIWYPDRYLCTELNNIWYLCTELDSSIGIEIQRHSFCAVVLRWFTALAFSQRFANKTSAHSLYWSWEGFASNSHCLKEWNYKWPIYYLYDHLVWETLKNSLILSKGEICCLYIPCVMKAFKTYLGWTLFLLAMGGISPYMSVTWQQPVETGLSLIGGHNLNPRNRVHVSDKTWLG